LTKAVQGPELVFDGPPQQTNSGP